MPCHRGAAVPLFFVAVFLFVVAATEQPEAQKLPPPGCSACSFSTCPSVTSGTFHFGPFWIIHPSIFSAGIQNAETLSRSTTSTLKCSRLVVPNRSVKCMRTVWCLCYISLLITTHLSAKLAAVSVPLGQTEDARRGKH